MLFPILLSLLSAAQALDPKSVSDANGITLWEKIEAMERQLIEPATLVSLVSPCGTNFGAPPFEGQQTSAEWVRLVFHDCITKNIAGPGLGGLDASIGFEGGRPENIGVFIDVSIGQFNQFTSVYLSMADLIGVGLADSLATCDPASHRLPLRVGRVDATQAGPFGVPGPADTLAFAQAAFERAGFSKTEMIQAVACGHSIGGVHGIDFPDIGGVPVKEENESGRLPFDTTPAVFDPNNINEYLDQTGSKGGPLVTTLNLTERSDDRIFKSDGLVTIKAMRTQAAFQETCFKIFDKMMNTVPASVTLSDPFQVRPFILRKGALDLTAAGVVVYNGTFTAHGNPPPSTITYTYVKTTGSNLGEKVSQVGVELPGFFDSRPPIPPQGPVYIGFNTIKNYTFGDVIGNNPLKSLVITSPGATYVGDLTTNIFILPSQSFTQQNRDGTGRWMVRVAILSTLTTSTTTPTATAWYPIPQVGTRASKIVSATSTFTFEKTLGAYKIYKASSFTGANPMPFVGANADVKVSAGTLVATKMNSEEFKKNCASVDISLC